MIRIFSHYVHRSALQGVLFDAGIVVLVAFVAVALQSHEPRQAVASSSTHAAAVAACLFLANSASGMYETGQVKSLARTLARALLVSLAALPLTYVVFGLLPDVIANRGAVQASMLASVGAIIARRAYVSHSAARTRSNRTRILIFGAGPAAVDVGQTLRAADPKADIVGYVAGPNERELAVPAKDLCTRAGTLPEVAHALDADEIVVALTERRAGSMPLRQLLDCKVSGVKVHDLNTHFEKTLGQIRVDYLNASWLIFGDGFNQDALRTAIKRASDIVFAVILSILGMPLMLGAALLIKLESRGPVLYRQERVGANGKTFSIAKFRSMRVDAEGDGKPRWASAQDDRVTRVGHVIRKLRIDELPQLFNVLRGDMSLVGPRPERPFFVEQLTQEIPFYALRHSVKPGVTGWAQVRYPYGATVEDSLQKLQFDLYYVKNHSLFLDLLVLFETVQVVLTGRGAR